jgi:electron transfer flavoprotein alpha subunit
VANLAVFVELEDGIPTIPSLSALGEARQAADVFGATVYAVAAARLDSRELDRLALTLGQSGADKILIATDAYVAGPPLDATLGGLLIAITERVRPVLFLFPAGGAGQQLGPPLALRTEATYFPHAVLGVTEPEDPALAGPDYLPRLLLVRTIAGEPARRTIDLVESERPAVVGMAAGPPPEPRGGPAELEVLAAPAPPEDARVVEIESAPDATAPAARAAMLILIDDAAPANAPARTERLREAASAVPGVAVVGTRALRAARARMLQACPMRLVGLDRSDEGLRTVGSIAAPPGGLVAVLGRKDEAPGARADVVWTIDGGRAIGELAAALGAAHAGAEP